MAIGLYIIKKINNRIKYLECIDEENLTALIKIAEEKNLPCFSLIDFVGDTIFNQKQVLQLFSEVEILAQYSSDSQSVELVRNAINQTLQHQTYYLLFNGE